MSKLQVGKHARVLRVPEKYEDWIEPGRVMAVEHLSDDLQTVWLYDITTPMIHGIKSLPQFSAEDLEPID